jgi:hypothetical protein
LSTKWTEVAANALWVGLNVCEYPVQGSSKFVLGHKVAIVGSGFAGVLPDTFRRIELRRVGRKLVDLQPMSIALEPSPDIRMLVVRGIVLN